MGGYGSTRWGAHDKAETVGTYRQLDAGELVRDGAIRPGGRVACSVSWRNAAGVATASVGVETDTGETAGRMRLSYTVTPYGGEPVALEYNVGLVSVPRHFGGRQWYFRCPLSQCGRRVKKLYIRGRYFGCRRCHGLTYESCQESHLFDSVFGDLAATSGYSPRHIRRLLMEHLGGGV